MRGPPADGMSLRLAVIGVGHLGKHHARILAALPGATLTTVVDTNQPRAREIAALHGVEPAFDYRDVLGRVEVWEHGKLRGSSDLVASRTVNKPGLVSRLGWYAGRTLHHLGGFF